MIPLSYATIVGGTITLIGTSTNLVVAGWMEAAGHKPLGLFTRTVVGLLVSVGVILYLTSAGHRLLPARCKPAPALPDGLFEVKVAADAPLIGKTIAETGLRNPGTDQHPVSLLVIVHLPPGDLPVVNHLAPLPAVFRSISRRMGHRGWHAISCSHAIFNPPPFSGRARTGLKARRSFA